jgi:putative PEP-CTERM system TPR-repeat lipoprotein
MFSRTAIALVCAGACVVGAFGCSRDVERAKRAYVERGDRYVAEQNVDAAIIEYRNAVQQDPKFGEAYRKLAAAYLTRGDGPEALRSALAAADLLPDSPEAQVEAGELLLLSRRFADAKVRAQQALVTNAKNTRARVLLGNSIAGLKDIDSAIREFEEAIRLDPKQSGVYTGLAVLKASQGDLAIAEQTFKQAIETDPTSVAARLALAQFYWSSQRLGDAEQTLKTALDAEPRNPSVNMAVAVFYQATHRAAEAEPFLRTAVEVDPSPRIQIAAADYFISRGRQDDAKPLLAPLAKDRKVGPLVSLRLAGIAQLEGRPEEALKILDDTLTAEPKNAVVLTAKSDVLQRQGKLDEAAKVAEEAIAANPTSAAAHFIRGRVLAAQGRLETAEKSFNDALRLNPSASAARVELARLKMASDAGDAVALARQAAKEAPRSLDAQLTLVRGLVQKHEDAEAERILSDLVKAAPDAAPVHALTGSLLARKRDNAGARAAFSRALAIDPIDVEALEGITAVDMTTGRAADAIGRLEALMQRTPDDFGLMMVMAKAYATSRNLPAAERVLVKAIDVNPSGLAAYSMLGQVYLAQKQLPAARAQFEKVVAQQDRPVGALTVIGMIDLLENRVSDAQRSFERVIKLDPRAAVAANNLAWIYAEHGGSIDMALQLAQVAQASMPNEAEVNDTLGWIYYKKGMLPQAEEALQRSLKLAPKNATAAYHLALVLEKTGNLAGARRMMTQYLTLDSTSARSADVKRRLEALGT